MAHKYHISKNGVAAICKAEKEKCPLGGIHYDTMKEAKVAADEMNEGEHGILPLTLSESNQDIQNKLNKLKLQLEDKVKHGKPFTKKEAKDRMKLVDEVMSSDYAKELHTYHDDDIDKEIVFSRDRIKQHEEFFLILDKKFENVPNEGKSIILAGIPGAGKSYAIRRNKDFNLDEYATVNSDDFKEMMAKEGMIPKIPGLTGLECVSLVHEETSMLFAEYSRRLRTQNKNIVLDSTCSNYHKTKEKVKEILNDGYDPKNSTMICIKSDPVISEGRVADRYKSGMDEYTTGKNSEGQYISEEDRIGGRTVPQFVLDDCKPKVGSVYKNEPEKGAFPSNCLTSSEQVFYLIMKDESIGINGIMYDNRFEGDPKKIDFNEFL